MSIQSDFIWIDGEMVPFADAKVHVLTHTLHYGLGAFEGIRAYKRSDGRTAVFRLKDHIRRLFDSCHIVTMKIPFSQEEICNACVETIQKNGFEDCYIRPVAFLGDGEMGLAALSNPIRISVICWKWGAYLGDEGLNNGIRAKISSFNRHHVNSSMVKGKINGQYVNSILAKREVMAQGFQEAIMLDTEGYVSEASGENIFIIRDKQIFTTPYGSSILGGITRDTILRLAKSFGHEVIEQRFTRDSLYTADEMFVVGTAAEVTPIREVDNRQIGIGKPGPITKQLQSAYFDLVSGSAADPNEWLTYIN